MPEQRRTETRSARRSDRSGRDLVKFLPARLYCAETDQRNTVLTMGMVSFFNRADTSNVVQVEFPLSPDNVEILYPNGAIGTVDRVVFDALYSQVLPTLPPCVLPVEEPEEPAYEAPSLSLLPPSYQLLYTTLRRIETKLDQLLYDGSKH